MHHFRDHTRNEYKGHNTKYFSFPFGSPNYFRKAPSSIPEYGKAFFFLFTSKYKSKGKLKDFNLETITYEESNFSIQVFWFGNWIDFLKWLQLNLHLVMRKFHQLFRSNNSFRRGSPSITLQQRKKINKNPKISKTFRDCSRKLTWSFTCCRSEQA